MQDRVPLYPGRVKLTPVAGQENTYDMVRADQPTQDGTPLNKDSLLKDTTASLYGLGVDAVPDDVLKLLSRFNSGLGNEYLWEKYKKTLAAVPSGSATAVILFDSNGANRKHIRYSDSVEISESGEILGLKEPITQTFPIYPSGVYEFANFAGKYFQYSATSYEDAKTKEISVCTKNMYQEGIGYRIDGATLMIVEQEDDVSFVNSKNPDAYPPAVPDGYTYKALGQVGNKVQIETGRYIGTGTYGQSNQNSLTFGFAPKFVFIQSDTDTGYNNSARPTIGIYIANTKSFLSYTPSKSGGNRVTANNNTITWYSTGVDYQLNAKAQYRYLAIG